MQAERKEGPWAGEEAGATARDPAGTAEQGVVGAGKAQAADPSSRTSWISSGSAIGVASRIAQAAPEDPRRAIRRKYRERVDDRLDRIEERVERLLEGGGGSREH